MKKKTAEEKELAGTNRPDKADRTAKVSDLTNIPEPEIFLIPAQKKIYNRLCEHVLEHSLLQTIDSLYISQVAVSFWLMASCVKTINKEGAVQKFKTGATNITGTYSVLKQERAFLNKAVINLGLSVRAREKLVSFSQTVLPTSKPTGEEKPKSAFSKKLKKVS